MESMTKDYMDLKQKFDKLQSPKREIKKWVNQPVDKD
jgi:hypothetical protein